MADEVAEFWNAFEKETGEKVEARAEGNWIRVSGSGAVHEGLLILTDKSFRFKYVPDTLRPFMGTRIPPALEDRSEFTVGAATSSPYTSRTGASLRGLSTGACRAAPWSCAVKVDKTYLFSADPSGGLIGALEKAWPAVARTVVR